MKLPTVRQIAQQFDVATGTAQQAVRDLVLAGFLESRPKRGTCVARDYEVGKLRSWVAGQRLQAQPAPGRSTSGIQKKRIHLLVSNLADPMVVEMAEAFAQEMASLGCRVQFDQSHPAIPCPVRDPDADALAIFQPEISGVDVVAGPNQVLLVVATDHAPVNLTGRYDLVSVDDEHGSFLAGRRLRDAGCASACFIGARKKGSAPPLFGTVSSRRLEGFQRGWGESLPTARLLKAESHNVEPGKRIVARYLEFAPRPEGIFADTDELAVGFILGARDQGLEPGRDFQIIGFDKQDLALSLPGGPLTTIEVPRRQMGQRGARVLADRLVNPDQPVRRIHLGCRVFEGTTVGEVGARTT